MHVLAGLLVAVFGAALAAFGPAFSREMGRDADGRWDRSNTVAFRAIGGVLVIAGLLYAIGVLDG